MIRSHGISYIIVNMQLIYVNAAHKNLFSDGELIYL